MPAGPPVAGGWSVLGMAGGFSTASGVTAVLKDGSCWSLMSAGGPGSSSCHLAPAFPFGSEGKLIKTSISGTVPGKAVFAEKKLFSVPSWPGFLSCWVFTQCSHPRGILKTKAKLLMFIKDPLDL